MRGAEHSLCTLCTRRDMAGKRAQPGIIMTSQLLSISSSISFRLLSEVHSVINKGNRTGNSVRFSFYSTVICLLLSAFITLLLQEKLLFSYKDITGQKKKVHFNIRILLEVRSLAAPTTMCKNLSL